MAYMDYDDAVAEVLHKAERITLPGQSEDVVTLARREFARQGHCEHRLIEPIEATLNECLRKWTRGQKKTIWESTETGMSNSASFEDFLLSSIDMHLEGELMFHIIEELASASET